MQPSERESLRALGLFADMAEAGFETLIRNAILKSATPGTELVRQADPAEFLHVVVEGRVEMWAASAGRETTLTILEPGGCFLLAAVLRARPCLMAARALTRARVLMIPAPAVRAAFAKDHAFALAVVTELSGAYRFMVRELKNQKLRSGPERLANWLIGALNTQKHNDEGSAIVQLGFEKRVLAAWLGMTPENLSRALAALAPYGVAVAGRMLTVSRPEELRRLAQPDPLLDLA